VRVLPGGVDQNVIDEVKSRNDIVDIVSLYVTLRKTGKNYVGVCPFHQEKTPSFTVAPDKQMFYCFGCHASGDVVSFIMKRENKAFYEALKSLADRAGIELPQTGSTPAENVAMKRRQAIYDSLSRAAEFYTKTLKEAQGKAALDYLLGRGITLETIDKFGLGYSPDAWDELAKTLRSKGFNEDVAVAAGLVMKRQKGTGVYDRFRNRVMFPIKDVRGRVIGFGARALDDSQPKYLNSPETEVFSKGRGLFALNMAREAARAERFIVVVEGYMDAISAHQAGVGQVVASLGTALTQDQAKQLAQISREVVLAYDSDSAGQEATLRGIEVLRTQGVSVRVCEVAEGKDPDEFIRARGSDAFRQLLKSAPSIVEYFLKRYVAEFGDTRAGRIKTVEAMSEVLATLDNAVELSSYISLVAGRTGTPVEVLANQVRRAKKNAAVALRDSAAGAQDHESDTKKPATTEYGGTRAEEEAERVLISVMIMDKDLRAAALRELADDLFTGRYAVVVAALSRPEFDQNVDVLALTELTGEEFAPLLAELSMRELPLDARERMKIMHACALVLKKRRLNVVVSQIAAMEPGGEGFQELVGEYQRLLRETKTSPVQDRHSSGKGG
jgi:DNA primase